MTPGGQLKPDLWTCKDIRQPYLSTFSISVSVLFHQIDSWPCQPVPSSISPLFIWPKLIIRVVSTTLPLLHLSLHNCTHSRDDAGQQKCPANSAKKKKYMSCSPSGVQQLHPYPDPRGREAAADGGSRWANPVPAPVYTHPHPPCQPLPPPDYPGGCYPGWLRTAQPAGKLIRVKSAAGREPLLYVRAIVTVCVSFFTCQACIQYIHYIIQYTPYTDVGSMCLVHVL